MNYFLAFYQLVQLVLGVVHLVHDVQAQMPGAPGADKSKAVLDKVTPIADALGANQEAIGGLITGVVGLAKAVGTIKRDQPAQVAAGAAAAAFEQLAP